MLMSTGLLATDHFSSDAGGSANPMNPLEMSNVFKKYFKDAGVTDVLDVDVKHSDPRASTFVLAWVATKFTEPIRLAITLAITPKVARMLSRRFR